MFKLSRAPRQFPNAFIYPTDRVDIVKPPSSKKKNQVNTYTELFRQTWLFPQIFKHLFERNPLDSDLKIISAGSSNGAEADTFLATCRRNKLGGKLAVRGFDINDEAIRMARTGQHRLYEFESEERLEKYRTTLKEYGFGVRDLVVDATSLRSAHDITFERKDLRTNTVGEEDADVVIANTFLHHLPSWEATPVALHLAEAVNNGGILSIGCLGEGHTDQRMPQSSLTYFEWIMEASDMFRADFGLRPVLHGADGQPVIFARD